MSAEKCGGNQHIDYPILQAIKARIEKLEYVEGYSAKADFLLNKIRAKYPNFVPASEDEIFFRARNLGIIDE